MGKPGKHAARLKALLDKHDEEAETTEALRTAKAMGDAVRAGDEEALAELTDKAKKKGWLK